MVPGSPGPSSSHRSENGAARREGSQRSSGLSECLCSPPLSLSLSLCACVCTCMCVCVCSMYIYMENSRTAWQTREKAGRRRRTRRETEEGLLAFGPGYVDSCLEEKWESLLAKSGKMSVIFRCRSVLILIFAEGRLVFFPCLCSFAES